MFFSKKKPNFEVVHSGRGGAINFKYMGKNDQFNIEMGPKGNFFVFTGRKTEYSDIRLALREYLNSTNRAGWIIDE